MSLQQKNLLNQQLRAQKYQQETRQIRNRESTEYQKQFFLKQGDSERQIDVVFEEAEAKNKLKYGYQEESPDARREKQKSLVQQQTPNFLENERSTAQKLNKVAISHDSTHMNTELHRDKNDLLLKNNNQNQMQNQPEDSEFSAEMDVASELDNKNGPNGRGLENGQEGEEVEQVRISKNGDDLQELMQNRMDIKMSYANSRYTGYTEKDIFSEYDEDEGDMDDDVASEHNELAQRIANATNRYSTSAYN